MNWEPNKNSIRKDLEVRGLPSGTAVVAFIADVMTEAYKRGGKKK